MVWPPATHQDVEDEIGLLRGGLNSFSATPTWRAEYSQRNSPLVPAVGRMILSPTVIPERLVITGLACRVDTAATAGGLIFIVLYNDTGGFLPGSLLANTGSIASDTAAVKSATFSGVTLLPGIYWVGILCTVASSSVETLNAVSQFAFGNWRVMPHGTGTLPTVNNGNDGSVALQDSLTTPPATFAGGYADAGGLSRQPYWVSMKVAAI